MPTKKSTNTKSSRPTKKQTKSTAKKVASKKKTTSKKTTAKKTSLKKASVKKPKAKTTSAKKSASKKKAVAKKTSTKKSAPKKKTVAKKTSTKKSTLKPASKATKVKKTTKKKATVGSKVNKLTKGEKLKMEELIASVSQKKDYSRISLEELFEGFDFEPTQPQTTSIISSVEPDGERFVATPPVSALEAQGSEELFEREYEEYQEHKGFLKKLVLATGVGIMAFLIGIFWLQVTLGYFDQFADTPNNIDKSLEQLRSGLEDIKKEVPQLDKERDILEDAFNKAQEKDQQVDQVLQEVKDELEK